MSEDTLVKQFVDAATKPLLAEIDRLRAELEKAQSGPAWDLSQKRAVEIIELRAEIDLLRADLAAEECAARDFEANQTYLLAEIETLREAGEGLAAALSTPNALHDARPALAAWRKARGEAGEPVGDIEELEAEAGAC